MLALNVGSRPKLVRRISLFLVFAVLLFVPVVMLGQSYFGTVTGEVTDPSGALVQGVQVVLTDQNKGYTFNATSDNGGRYLFTAVSPGVYSVSAEMAGFAKAVRANVKLNVTENLSVNFRLTLASTTEVVQVDAQAAPTLATEDAVTGEVVNRRFINDLPIIDRYVMELVYLAPGLTDMSDQNHVGDTGTNFVSNGSRGASADILMDGASMTNFEPNGGITQATYTPSAEAVEEFKIQQTNFSAEYGFTGASVVNMITRSGGNSFHGSAYDFIRNAMTDSNNWFANEYGQPLPPLHRHNYGGTIGGPILKNKTFFFFDWDGTRQSTQGVYQAGVPSAAERTGDFGELCGDNGGSFNSSGMCVDSTNTLVPAGQLWDPYTGVYCAIAAGDPAICPPPNPNNPPPAGAYRSAFIPNNNLAAYTSPGDKALQLQQVPGNLIDGVGQKMMNLFPSPNLNTGNPYYNWGASGPSYWYNDQFDIKIDHRFNENNLLSVKYSQEWSHFSVYNCFKNFTDPCGSGPNNGTSHLIAINDTHTFGPRAVLTTTFGFTRGAFRNFQYNPSLGSDPLGTLGFPSYLKSNGVNGVPAIYIQGGYYSAGSTNIGDDPYGNTIQGQDTGQVGTVLNLIRGKHDLKFGFEGRLHQQNLFGTNAPLGNFNFNTLGSSQCPNSDNTVCGGDGMASFMMGMFAGGGYEIQFAPATENFQYAWFVQDNWKVDRKLTLNLGLRYDVNLPRTERHNRMNSYDPNVTNPLNGGSISYVDPVSGENVTRALLGGEIFNNASNRTNWTTDWKDIQPRFGFAYQIEPKTVIRGGYGIYFGQNRSGANGLLSYGSQGYNQYTNLITTYDNDGATPYLRMNNPFPNGLIQPPGNKLGLLNDVGYFASGPIRSGSADRTPYEQSWSFGIERDLGWGSRLDVQYVGKKGTHLYFSGATQLDVVGPQVENYSQTQMSSLVSPVTNPFYKVITDPNSVLSYPTTYGYQLEVPSPQFTNVTTDVLPIANSTYHALQIVVQKRYTNGLQLSANYTWSKSIDDSSIYDDNLTWLGSFTSLQDPNKPWKERSLSTFDVPSVLKINYTYDLPVGRGRTFLGNMPRALDLILGGWKTNGMWIWQDGRPLSFSVENGGNPIPTYGSQRPNISGKLERSGGSELNWINNYFANPDVLSTPNPYTLGNMGRAIGLRTPFNFTTNLSIGKEFGLSSKHEGMKLEMRMEAQNAFNHPVFGTPDTTVGDPSFGQISYTNTNGSGNGAREVQLALKFSF